MNVTQTPTTLRNGMLIQLIALNEPKNNHALKLIINNKNVCVFFFSFGETNYRRRRRPK